MEEWKVLHDHLFVTTFEKYLCKLNYMGFSSKSYYPENDNEEPCLVYKGSFIIRIERQEHWYNALIHFLPKNAIPETKGLLFSAVIFYLSGNKDYFEPSLCNIGHHLPYYDSEIKRICEKLMEYVELIEPHMRLENYENFHSEILKNRPFLIEAMEDYIKAPHVKR